MSVIRGKPKYLEYLPDNVKLENISKEFLFSVRILFNFQLIANVEPNVYAQMYDLYKKKSAENVLKKWDEFSIEISTNVANEINNFVPIKK